MKKIQILGTGCPKCKTLMANAERAAQEAGIEYAIEKVQDINDIVSFGVMTTPALALNGKVVSAGKMLSADEIKKFFS
ncbi:MAG: thioredoxin family protein [Candidatus Omnitrophota bacterium]